MAGVKRGGVCHAEWRGRRCEMPSNHEGVHGDKDGPFREGAAPPPATPPDTYRMVDFVKAVAMRDDRGMEVRVNRVRLGAPVDRESPMKVRGIVLNGTWFDIFTSTEGEHPIGHAYRVHVTNVVSAER